MRNGLRPGKLKKLDLSSFLRYLINNYVILLEFNVIRQLPVLSSLPGQLQDNHGTIYAVSDNVNLTLTRPGTFKSDLIITSVYEQVGSINIVSSTNYIGFTPRVLASSEWLRLYHLMPSD